MTATQNSQQRPGSARGRRVLLAGALLAAVAAGGAVYLVRSRAAPPVPPDAPADESDPAVAPAVRVVRERVLKAPRSAAAWGDLGKVFLANGLEEQSKLCFAEAACLDPRDPRWPYYLAGWLLTRGDREGALPDLRRAADLAEPEEGTNPTARLSLAETLLALGRLDEAEGHFRRVLAERPDDVRAHYGMGLLASARGDWEASRAHLVRCLDSPMARQKASVQLAAVSRRLGNEAEADRFQDQAAHAPRDVDWDDPYEIEYMSLAVQKRARYTLIEQLEAAGRFAEAAPLLRQLAEDYPDDFFTHLALARELEAQGDHRRAEESLRRALRLGPDKVQVHYYLSLVLLTEGRELAAQGEGDKARARDLYREAAEQARQALALAPDYGFAYMTLGRSLEQLGQCEKALDALRQAVRCDPGSARLHFELGDALAAAGQDAEARRHLEEALAVGAPGAPWRRAALMRLDALKKDGKPDG